MANVKFKLDSAGIQQLLKSKEVSAVIEAKAKAVLASCPDIGYGMTMGSTDQRARAFVGTRSVYSIRHNNKHNTLLNAIGGGK